MPQWFPLKKYKNPPKNTTNLPLAKFCKFLRDFYIFREKNGLLFQKHFSCNFRRFFYDPLFLFNVCFSLLINKKYRKTPFLVPPAKQTFLKKSLLSRGYYQQPCHNFKKKRGRFHGFSLGTNLRKILFLYFKAIFFCFSLIKSARSVFHI